MYYKIIDKETCKTLAEDSSSYYAMRKAIEMEYRRDLSVYEFLQNFCTFEDEVYTLDAGKHYHCSFPSSVNNYSKIVQNLLQQYFNCIVADPAFHDLKIEIIEG
jgi:hypothetical protein